MKLIQIRYKSTHWSRKPINCSNGYEERTSRCSPLHWLSSGIYDGNRKIALEQGNFINWSILRFTCTSTQNLAINKSIAPSLLQIGEDQLQFSSWTQKLKFNQLIGSLYGGFSTLEDIYKTRGQVLSKPVENDAGTMCGTQFDANTI